MGTIIGNGETEDIYFQINDGQPQHLGSKEGGTDFSLVLREGSIGFTDGEGQTFSLYTEKRKKDD